MNAQCTHCNTIFRVDPHKIPAGGVRARCSICRNTFQIAAPLATSSSGPSAAPTPAAAVQQAAAPAVVTPRSTRVPAAAPVVPAPTESVARPVAAPAAPPAPPAQASRPVAPTPAPAPAAPAVPPPSPAGAPAARNPFAFGANDPGAKARRLARALISDIVTYHPERRDQALAEGTLKREFMEEIKKSWEEYVAQVGTNVARSTPHFRDALNEILARGNPVF